MPIEIESLQDYQFKELMQEHIFNVVEFLFESNQEFGVACEIKHVVFNPQLPEDIRKSLPISPFIIMRTH